ncbi:MAG: helix-turn-helix domain-containing protein [Chthoniobacter sp.]|nr:helix-turn-helix domain-containing protein [Chthoniobacter sp.]
MEGRKGSREKIGKRPVHLFAGLAVCSCGQKMYPPSSTPKYVCSKCRNKIPAVDLEAIFIEELEGFLLSPERIAEYLEKANVTKNEKRQLIETLSGDLQKVKAEADKIFRLYMDDGLSKDLFKERYQPLEERKKQIEEELPKAEAELSLLQVDSLSSEYILEEARDVKACWPTMTTDEKRRIVESLVKRITIGADEIDISLCYLPSFREMTNRHRTLRDSVPFCWVTLHRVRCPIGPYFTEKNGYPASPKTIGEMIRKHRLDLGLRQRDVAEIIGCNTATVTNWEKSHTAFPQINHMAGVVRFLGFNPLPNGDTVAQRLVNHRKALGVTQKDFAREIGVDPSTLAKWERGERTPTGKYLDRVRVRCPFNSAQP